MQRIHPSTGATKVRGEKRRPSGLARTAALTLGLWLAAAAAGCGGGNETGGKGGDGGFAPDSGGCPTYAEVTIWPLCTSCHASTLLDNVSRKEATPGVDFDTYASAANNAVNAQLYVSALVMPPPGEPQPTADQVASFNKWISCGTPP